MQSKIKNERMIMGIGGIAVDVISRSEVPVRLHDSNPGCVTISAGGVTRNICENLARMGCRVGMLSVIGNDVFGKTAAEQTAAAGVEMEHVLISETGRTACYLAILDRDGDMFAASSDFAIVPQISEEYIDQNREVIRASSAVVTDANLSPAQLEMILQAAGNIPVFLDPVSEAKAGRIRELAGAFTMIKPNRMELEALTGVKCTSDEAIDTACEMLIRKGCRTVAVSLGERGCYCRDADGTSVFRKPFTVARMENATGAGDAFMAGYVSGFVRDLDLRGRLDRALAAGYIAVRSKTAINKEMSDDLIHKTIQTVK